MSSACWSPTQSPGPDATSSVKPSLISTWPASQNPFLPCLPYASSALGACWSFPGGVRVSYQTVGSLSIGTVSEPPWAQTVSLTGPCWYLHGFSHASSWKVSVKHPVWGWNGLASQCQLWKSWALEQGAEGNRRAGTGGSPGQAVADPVFTHLVLTFHKSIHFSLSLLKAL